MNKEIKILGAGVSGLTAAIVLSKNDFKVKIFEKEDRVGKRNNHICAIRNYEKKDCLEKIKNLGLNIKPSKKINSVIRYSPSGFISKTVSLRSIFYIFERGHFFDNSLEEQLLKQAKDNNVEIIYNKTVKAADIIATGPKKSKANIFGYGKIYEGTLENVILFYNNNYSPKGYLCVLPSKDKFQILAVSFDKNEFGFLKRGFEKAIKKNKILRELVNNHKVIRNVEGFGNYFNPIGYKNGKYYVGEAGGFQDAARGFGTWYAILTGYLAARSIIENSDYNEKWKRDLLNELRESMKRRKLFNSLSNEDFDNIIKKMGEKISLEEYIKLKRV